MPRYKVADLDQLRPGALVGVEAGGEPICLARLEDGSVHAVSDTCTHEQASLSEGEIWEGSVQCPQHGSLFDLRTGKVTGLPAQIPVRTFPIVIEDGAIIVETDRPGPTS